MGTSGSVVDSWVSLLRRSPRKFTVGFPGSPSVRPLPFAFRFFGRKLFSDAQASISVPSTVK
jgi:hypothetical protein